MYDKQGTIIDRREMLRVKVKTLAIEARVIRREEGRTNGVLQYELHNHRVNELRREARSAHIAYGLIKGRAMKQIENKASTPPDQKRVEALIKKYGPKPS